MAVAQRAIALVLRYATIHYKVMYTSTKVRDECILLPRMGHSNLLPKFGTRAAVTSVSSGVPSLGAPLRSATGAMTQCDDSNVYWHPIVLNTLLKISSYIYVKI